MAAQWELAIFAAITIFFYIVFLVHERAEYEGHYQDSIVYGAVSSVGWAVLAFVWFWATATAGITMWPPSFLFLAMFVINMVEVLKCAALAGYEVFTDE